MDRTDAGTLIAFEGIDGAGKTTQARLLAEHLRSAGETVVSSKEPTDGPWGRKIRASATAGRLPPADELLAFTEDRKEHVRDLILPALKRGETVILDRYLYSTIAYQGSNGFDPDALVAEMLAAFPIPDVVILIDVPPVVGLARIRDGRGETPNAFEQLSHLEAIRRLFLVLAAKHGNVRVFDGTRDVAAVHRAIVQYLLNGPLV
jgi:dTMP kinase